ncbi:hypothetical protein C5L14_10115 [Labrys okinawensis]|uniref:DUF2059 domain-containing protein n=2 Tax=Labrys okinawensis TaxID=346911 RepID=A0A2S9QFU6_9HYPH|nr:hypothetical protein C5L14_10115 [Labrys okinawensis]
MLGRMLFAAAALVGLLTTGAMADDQGRLALARQVVQAMHATDTMRQALPLMMANMKPMLDRQPGTTEKFRDLFMARFLEKANTELDQFADEIAQIYAQQFSEEDLKNLIAFYESPTGKNLVSKQAILIAASSAAGRQWGMKVAGEALQQYADELAKAQASDGAVPFPAKPAAPDAGPPPVVTPPKPSAAQPG